MKFKLSSLADMDWILVFSTVLLSVIGILFIYSSGITSSGVSISDEHIKQIVWVSTGVLWMFAAAMVDYSRLKDLTFLIYLAFIFLLIITLLFGEVVNGARSWLGFMGFGIQPSEFTKLATILFLSAYLDNIGPHIRKLHRLLIAFGIALFPMGLILLQPDMGTSLVYMPLFLVISFMAGASLRHIIFFLLTGLGTAYITVLPVWQDYFHQARSPVVSVLVNTDLTRILGLSLTAAWLVAAVAWFVSRRRYFYWIGYCLLISIGSVVTGQLIRSVLKEYQIMRLIVFIDPQVDPKGAGWNIIQSVTAIGSGGFSGKGYLQGTQSHYQFLPQQSTDFIFSILAEEWGFTGGLVVITLFTIILLRGLFIINYSRDKFGVYLATGIILLFFFHVFVNIGMAMGIMPITGIPLYFLSYGGSSLWTGMFSMGFLISVYRRRYRN